MARTTTDSTPIRNKLFPMIHFESLADNDEFKEDSVREEVIVPILRELGYQPPDIVRSKSVRHPFVRIGSKKRKITLIPDYCLKSQGSFAWVLDAKSPTEKVSDPDNIEQVYGYSAHDEIKAPYFALCNGTDFILFRRESDGKALLSFKVAEIDFNWHQLNKYLGQRSFHVGKEATYESTVADSKSEFDYGTRQLLDELPVRKQEVKRHFGVHGYFTRQAWNVVQAYIANFSQKDDVVLDPFGGTGVTAIEAMTIGRKAINVDLNPLAVFMVSALVAPVKPTEALEQLDRILNEFSSRKPSTEKQVKTLLNELSLPEDINLPRGSDVPTLHQLFTPNQLAELALLKSLILQIANKGLRETFLLMFSSVITKFNLTYHASKGRSEGRGDSAAFRYYRYRIAPRPAKLELENYFRLRFRRIMEAKAEMRLTINEDTLKNLDNRKGSALKLDWIKSETVDYIYTDPPYGKKIPYLDLSTMWNAWLDLTVTESDLASEAIEGGEVQHSKTEYNQMIAGAIAEMYRVLKFGRWMSFVFAHKDPEFWHLILESSEKVGFEYMGASAQKNGQTSFKKRQNPFTVLSGQLIINFRKVENPRTILKANLGMDIGDIVIQTIEGVIAKFGGATLEQINDELILKGLELGFLDLLKKRYSDLTPLLTSHFQYNETTQQFSIPSSKKFKTHVDERLRVRYYVLSYLKRMQLAKKIATFDDIVLEILPLLRNGKTPENQTILRVLQDVAVRVGENSWALDNNNPQGQLL